MHNPPAPQPRERNPRLTDEHRAMLPNQSLLLDEETVKCVRAHGRYVGWRMVQRSEGTMMRVWRLEDK